MNKQTGTHTHMHTHSHIAHTVAAHCVLSGEFHQLFTRVRVGKFMTVLDKTINNKTHTVLANTHTHTELPSFMSRVFDDKEGAGHYIIRAKWLHLISPSITHQKPRREKGREVEGITERQGDKLRGRMELMNMMGEQGKVRQRGDMSRWWDWETWSVGGRRWTQQWKGYKTDKLFRTKRRSVSQRGRARRVG